MPNSKKLSNMPGGCGISSGRVFAGLWGRWWGVKHAKRHISSTGLSYLVAGCSWQFRADTGPGIAHAGPVCVQIVGFLNGACAGLMWRFRALWLVVKTPCPSRQVPHDTPCLSQQTKGRSQQVVPIIVPPWPVGMSPRCPPPKKKTRTVSCVTGQPAVYYVTGASSVLICACSCTCCTPTHPDPR